MAALAAALACGGLLAAFPPAARAAEYETFVTCSAEPGEPLLPSHACTIGQQPKAFFESGTTVTVHSCLVAPTGRERCSSDFVAEANRLYVSTITTNLLGKFEVRWFVEGAEVGNWPFEMLTAEEQEEEGPRSQRTLLACARTPFGSLVFLAHPQGCADLMEVAGATRAGTMRGIRWRDWNSPSAQGHGRFSYCGKHGCAGGTARIAAYDRKFACGRYAYARLLIHVALRGRPGLVVRAELPPC